MFRIVLVLGLMVYLPSAAAGCSEFKDRVDAKLQAKGITAYSLEIRPVVKSSPPASSVPGKGEGSVLGTCDGDRKQLVYKRALPAEITR